MKKITLKNKAKTISAAMLSAVLTISFNAGAEDITKYLNEGYITFTGENQQVKSGDDVTLTVVKEGYDYDNEAAWSNADAENVVFYGTTTMSGSSTYQFNFALDDSGMYDAYVGFEGVSTPEIFKIEYTNKTRNDTAVDLLKNYVQSGTSTDVKTLLENSRNDLRLYTDLYSVGACTDAGEMIHTYFKGLNDTTKITSDSVKEIGERAFAIDKLNDKQQISLEANKEILKFTDEKFSKYYNNEYEEQIKYFLQLTPIAGITDYDARLIEALVIPAINNCDGTQIISDALSAFPTECGAVGKTITDNLLSAIANNGGFTSISALKSFVEGYVEPSGGNDGGYTGSTGGGTGGGGGSYVVPPMSAETNKDANISVFDDIGDDFWGKDAINELYKKSIVAGKTENLFCPNDRITREEFVTLLVRAFKFDMIDDDFYFEDVPEDAWYYDYVRSAYLGYVVKGISETKFGSGMDITRQDLSVMVYNAAASSAVELPEVNAKVTFSDSAKISDYAKTAVEALQKAGIISGYEDNSFKPKGNATRAEAATMIYKMMNYIK